MPDTLLFIYTVAAGSVFTFALLWIIAQWLRSDKEVEDFEKEFQLELAKDTPAQADSEREVA